MSIRIGNNNSIKNSNIAETINNNSSQDSNSKEKFYDKHPVIWVIFI